MQNQYIKYEELVRDLLKKDFKDDFVPYHNKHYLGKRTGHNHQIDVSFEGCIANTNFLILGECKFYKKPVSIEKVMVLAFRLNDIGAHKGLMITTNGFQKGCFKIASSLGISLLICRNKSIMVQLKKDNVIESTETFINYGKLSTLKTEFEFGEIISDNSCKKTEFRSVLNSLKYG